MTQPIEQSEFKNHGKRWNDDENTYLMENCKNLTLTEMSTYLSRTENAIGLQIAKLATENEDINETYGEYQYINIKRYATQLEKRKQCDSIRVRKSAREIPRLLIKKS